jgi:hypothetical protein
MTVARAKKTPVGAAATGRLVCPTCLSPRVARWRAPRPTNRPWWTIIETYLGNLMDPLLVDAASDTAVTPACTSNPGMPIRAARARS